MNHVVPHDELLAVQPQLAADIVSNDQDGVRHIIDTYDAGTLTTRDDWWNLEIRRSREWMQSRRVLGAEVESRREAIMARGRKQVALNAFASGRRRSRGCGAPCPLACSGRGQRKRVRPSTAPGVVVDTSFVDATCVDLANWPRRLQPAYLDLQSLGGVDATDPTRDERLHGDG